VQAASGFRPTLMSTQGMVSTGHYLASAAAAFILKRGGNAIDAGIAAGLCLNVVHADMNSFSGVAPIILYDARLGRVVSYRGIGWWPAAITPDYFIRHHDGDMPNDVISCVVPGAPDAWLYALKEHGTMRFEEICSTALTYAQQGFPVHKFMRQTIASNKQAFSWPTTARLFLPRDGEPPDVGDRFTQPELAQTFRSLIEVERSNSNKGRPAAIQAIRDYVYQGPIAETMVAFARSRGGLFTLDDFAAFEADAYPSVRVDFGRFTIHACGPWSQGPVVPLALNILKNFDLKSMGHNTAEYVHTVVEALNLAFSDRHHFMGDPAHVAVPIDGLLSPAYGKERAALIVEARTLGKMAPAGDPWRHQSAAIAWPERSVESLTVYRNVPAPGSESKDTDPWDDDTSYVSCVDSFGNFFSATPSDGVGGASPIIPELGLPLSKRGGQSWTDPRNPNSVGPRKRPRLTPNPGLIFRDGHPWAAYGTPGNDRQPQAMLQVFLNIAVFGMEPQEAVQAPRVATFNFPASSHPHEYFPGLLRCEKRISQDVVDALSSWGHRIELWPEYMPASGAPCIVIRDADTGIFRGAADPRRQSYAIGF
jgi:gamma-glutamyltranspeptidase/glutathione hydrolase